MFDLFYRLSNFFLIVKNLHPCVCYFRSINLFTGIAYHMVFFFRIGVIGDIIIMIAVIYYKRPHFQLEGVI